MTLLPLAHTHYPSVGSSPPAGDTWGFESDSELSDFTWLRTQANTSASGYRSRTTASYSVGSSSLEGDTDYLDVVGIITGDTDTTFVLDMDFQYNSGEDQYVGLWYGAYRDGQGDLFDGVCFVVRHSDETAYLCSFLGDGNPDIYTPDDSYDFSGDSFSDGTWYHLRLDVAHSGTTVTVEAKLMSQDEGTTYDTLSNVFTSDGSWTTDKGLYMYNEGEPGTKQRVDHLVKT